MKMMLQISNWVKFLFSMTLVIFLFVACAGFDDSVSSRRVARPHLIPFEYSTSSAATQQRSAYRQETSEKIPTIYSNQAAGASASGRETEYATSDQVVIPLHGERARVTREVVPSENIRLRKVVRYETTYQPITLRREYVEVVRDGRMTHRSSPSVRQTSDSRAVSSYSSDREGVGASQSGSRMGESQSDELIIPVYEERAVIGKETVVKEHIRVRKNVETRNVQVPTTLREEDVEVIPSDRPNQVIYRESSPPAAPRPRLSLEK